MIYSALAIGFVGSLHCAAMCGPLMLGLSKRNYSIPSLIIHHLGRWIGYILLALLFRLIVSPLHVFQVQQYVGIISGLLLLLYGFKNYIPFVQKTITKFSQVITTKMSSQKTGRQGSLVLGILNGLLPCGLSFGTAILSVNLESVSMSALYMILFGIGTLPMLFAISYFPNVSWFKNLFGRWSLASNKVIIIMGLVLLIRSAQLGIPYVSPTYNPATNQSECCEE